MYTVFCLEKMRSVLHNSVLQSRTRLWRCVAFLLLFSMAAHIVDACAAHLGLPGTVAPVTQQQVSPPSTACHDATSIRFISACVDSEHEQANLCEVTSEQVHRLDEIADLKASLTALSAWAKLPAAVYQLLPAPPTKWLPDATNYTRTPSLTLCAPLAGRAPPPHTAL